MKRNILIIVLTCMFLSVCAGFIIYIMRRNVTQDVGEVAEEATKQESGPVDDRSSEGGDAQQDSTEAMETEMVSVAGLTLELLDYRIVDSLKEYPVEKDHCNSAYYPTDGVDQCYEIYVDWDRVYEEAPDYRESVLHPDKYTEEQREEFFIKSLDIQEKYMDERMVSYDYVVVTCRMTNTMVDEDGISIANEVCVADQSLVVTDVYGWTPLEPLYFDQAQHTGTGDTGLYFYNMEPEETLEYTMLFPVREEDVERAERFSFGLWQAINTMEGIYWNPSDLDTMWALEVKR